MKKIKNLVIKAIIKKLNKAKASRILSYNEKYDQLSLRYNQNKELESLKHRHAQLTYGISSRYIV